jgi:hypothetical protein
MDKVQAIKLMNDLSDEGYDARLYEEYSGRGMNGTTTIGVVSDKRFDSKKFKSDSMGKQFIYY